MLFWHLVLKVLSHNSYRCNQQKCYVETIQFLDHLNDLLIMLLFYHYSSLIIKPVFLKFFFLCLKSKIVQLKTQFDMHFDSYRQGHVKKYQTLLWTLQKMQNWLFLISFTISDYFATNFQKRCNSGIKTDLKKFDLVKPISNREMVKKQHCCFVTIFLHTYMISIWFNNSGA